MQPYLVAEYTDGYIHSEKELDDVSPYLQGRNVFYDISEGLPAVEHGPMVKLTLFYNDKKYEIDWTQVPATARPHRLKHMRRDRVMEQHPNDPEMSVISDSITVEKVEFGYQWTDKSVEPWQNHKVIREL